MIGFVLTGHGDFAPGLFSSVKMIAGDQEEFDVVPFHDEGAEAEAFPQRLREVVTASAERNDAVIVFCDLQGGTPFNQAMMLTAEMPAVQVVAGANLPLLLEAATDRADTPDPEALIDGALEAGRSGLVHLSLSPVGEDEDDDLDGEGI